jgi:phage major head subunit gpT-like protein
MIIKGAQITRMGVGFQTRFQNQLKSAVSMRTAIATEVTSGTKLEEYDWLDDLPGIREWIGDRKIRKPALNTYVLKNQDWEGTLEVDRNDVEDDNVGAYNIKIDLLADGANRHPDELCFGVLNSGFDNVCFDGQPYFDDEHPIIGADGKETTFANTDGGDGPKWFVVNSGAPLLPVIFQNRKSYNFVSKDSANDEGVFWQKKFYYGCDARYTGGYSLPQLSWGSGQTLDAAHYNAARKALVAMPKPGGGKFAATKLALVFGPSNLAAAEATVKAAQLANGATNTNFGTADLVCAPWLD